uniref:V-set and immunoglobulin domain-containing protein 1 n=1 Tax=Sphenodon punctatus TaxID=8508 RepID=A0A8D0L1F4_SPHPU
MFLLEIQIDLSLLCFIYSGPISSVVVTVPTSAVQTLVGGNATLLCTYTTSGQQSGMFIQWSFYSAKKKHPQTIYFYQNGQAYDYGEFKNRIQGATNPGNASVTIFNMKASETGQYTCEVFNPQDTNTQNQKTVILDVLVKPAQPHCSIRGTPETGHIISLSCYSDEGMPLPTYQWHKVSGETLSLMTEQVNPQTGLLIIGNLTNFEKGYYRCIASNSLGNSSCEIDLTSHSDGGIIAGALIGGILGAIVICIIVWVLATKEKKKKRKEKAAVREME